jgi:ketosteroid isomerase-like protein
MLNSDVTALDELLADELIFTNHLGQTMTKQDDLDAHRSGFVKIETIDLSEQRIKIAGDIAIVSVLSNICGEFGGTKAETALRFTRVWQKRASDCWQVIAAHSSVAA